jgi:hypothetical protein
MFESDVKLGDTIIKTDTNNGRKYKMFVKKRGGNIEPEIPFMATSTWNVDIVTLFSEQNDFSECIAAHRMLFDYRRGKIILTEKQINK